MRKVEISHQVMRQMGDLASYLLNDLMLSDEAVQKYMGKMGEFLYSLRAPVSHQLCRFKRWQAMGWRCTVFKHDWIVAYEVFDEGVIIQDICHTKLLKE